MQSILLFFQYRQVSFGIGSSIGSALKTTYGLLRGEKAGLEAPDLSVGIGNSIVEHLELVQQVAVFFNLQGVFGLEELLVYFKAFYPGSEVEAITLGIGHVGLMAGEEGLESKG